MQKYFKSLFLNWQFFNAWFGMNIWSFEQIDESPVIPRLDYLATQLCFDYSVTVGERAHVRFTFQFHKFLIGRTIFPHANDVKGNRMH